MRRALCPAENFLGFFRRIGGVRRRAEGHRYKLSYPLPVFPSEGHRNKIARLQRFILGAIVKIHSDTVQMNPTIPIDRSHLFRPLRFQYTLPGRYCQTREPPPL